MRGCEEVVKMVRRINRDVVVSERPFKGNISKVASQVVMCDVCEMHPERLYLQPPV